MYKISRPEKTASAEKYPQGYFKPKGCKRCNSIFQPIAPSHMFCSDDCRDKDARDSYLRRTYGVTLDWYNEQLKAQGSSCAICGSEGFLMKSGHSMKLVVDHCHESGEVRGLLCHNCNRALGLLKDDIQSLSNALMYLKGATTIPNGSTPK